jgi:Uma2 family endonuclease
MTMPATSSKPFKVGTTGWTVRDLLDPAFEFQYMEGRYEIVEGVLTQMPPAYFFGQNRLDRLIDTLKGGMRASGLKGEFATEVDVALHEDRVVRVDAIFLPADDLRKQSEEVAARGDFPEDASPIFVTPTLIIESISRGHERHDRVTKRRWYAEARVPNYWLFNTLDRSLECLGLGRRGYKVDQAGSGNDELRPSMFPGLVIHLSKIWGNR